MPETPNLDILNQRHTEHVALMEFLEEFLPQEKISLYQWATGLTDQRPCSGPRGGLMDLCPHQQDPTVDCPKCNNTGVYEIQIEDRDLPYTGTIQELVYRFLGVDYQEVEKERRAILEEFRNMT